MKGLIALGLSLAAALACAQTQPQQLIVQLQPGADPAQLGMDHGAQLVDVTDAAPFALYNVPIGVDVHVIQAAMLLDSRVVFAEDNAEIADPEGQGAIRGSTMPAIGDRRALYAANTNVLQQISWNSTLANTPGRKVRVAILDTGLSRYQDYLWRKVDASANFIEADARYPNDLPGRYDTNGNGIRDEAAGHGTMIAGIIDQISPLSRFVIARVADSDGIASSWTVTKGLAFAVNSGAELANISLGSPNRVPALSDVLDWCETHNLLVISGVGNANTDEAFFPAGYSKVVAVSGLNPNNTKASFSNWDNHTRSAAPATGIVSQWWNGKMGIWSGTSFSAPMVTASLADGLRRSLGPVNVEDLRDIVEDTGTNIESLNPQYEDDLGTLLHFERMNLALALR